MSKHRRWERSLGQPRKSRALLGPQALPCPVSTLAHAFVAAVLAGNTGTALTHLPMTCSEAGKQTGTVHRLWSTLRTNPHQALLLASIVPTLGVPSPQSSCPVALLTELVTYLLWVHLLRITRKAFSVGRWLLRFEDAGPSSGDHGPNGLSYER